METRRWNKMPLTNQLMAYCFTRVSIVSAAGDRKKI